MRLTKLFGVGLTSTVAVVAATLQAPTASASESSDLWDDINAVHTAAGCPAYGNAPQLANVALQLAQNMVGNNGAKNAPGGFAPTTENLLNQQGYFFTSSGEMDNYDTIDPRNITSTEPYPPPGPPHAGSGKDQFAMDYWQQHGMGPLMANCGITQMEVAVWENGNKWAAVSLMGTPGAAPGPLPPGDQPH